MTRTLRILTVPLLMALALAGCAETGGDNNGIATAGGNASASPSAGAGEELSDDERRLKFAECMRENGIDMPDPGEGGGGVRIRAGEGTTPEEVDAAMKACKQYAPNGGEPIKLSPEQVEQMRKFAKCMRENGVPEFPDPDPNGRVAIQRRRGQGADEKTFEAAQEKCRQFRPVRPSGAPR
jgi:hypothetical protein